MYVAVDFDNTCCKNAFPDIGEEIDGCIETLKFIQKCGHKVTIWTCRVDEYLDMAKNWLESKGFVADAYNDNPPGFMEYLNEKHPDVNFCFGRKIGADIFIDDKNFGGFPGWRVVKQYFETLHIKDVGMSSAWPTHEILDKLCDAANILLIEMDYDRHGYETIEYCMQAGRARADQLRIFLNQKEQHENCKE